MSIGIGLGGFVDGLYKGVQVGTKMRDMRQENQQQAELKQIATDAQAKFGDVMSDEAYDYMMQRQQNVLLQNGQLDDARRLRTWSQQDSARKGTKLFASIGAALNMGDFETAAQLGNELSDLDGYGPNGDYQFEYTTHPTQGAGFYVKSENGEAFVPEANALPFFTRHFNPQAAASWNSDRKKDNKALEKEAQDIREAAIKSLEKQYDGGLGGDEKSFKDMPDEERERLINKYALERIAPGRREKFQSYFSGSGKPTKTQPKGTAPGLIVDQNTGQKVESPRAQASEEKAPGADGSIVAKELAPLEGNAPGVPSPSAGPGATTETPQAPGHLDGIINTGDAVRAAEQEMRDSGNAKAAASRLKAAGVPEQAWPRSIKRALRERVPAGIASPPQ